MINTLGLRLKLLIRDRMTCIIYILTAAVFVVVLSSLNIHSEERSRIPIGLTDEDNSEASERLTEEIKKNSALYVYEGSASELDRLLIDGYINSMYIINDGYEERLRSGEKNELLSVYSCKDDRTAVVVSDIIAGCMMYDVCLSKSYNTYAGLKGTTEKLEKAAYISYVDNMLASEEYSFGFEAEYRNQQESREDSAVSNGIIYKQVIAGMIAMLLSFIVFFTFNSLCQEKENKLSLRKKLTPAKHFLRIIGEATASVLFTFPLIILITVFVAGGSENTAAIVLTGFIYIVIMSIIFLPAALLAKSVAGYQLVGAVVIMLFGVAGFFSAFSGIIVGSEGTVADFMPNSVFVDILAGLI